MKIITSLAFLVPASLLVWFCADSNLPGILATILIFIVFAVVYAYAPKEVVLEGDKVVINGLFGQVTIPCSKIREVSYFERLNWKTIRLFGSGGLYRWFGLFHVPGTGDMNNFRIYILVSFFDLVDSSRYSHHFLYWCFCRAV